MTTKWTYIEFMPNFNNFLVCRQNKPLPLLKLDRLDWRVVVVVLDIIGSRGSKVKKKDLPGRCADSEVEGVLVAESRNLRYKVHVSRGERSKHFKF